MPKFMGELIKSTAKVAIGNVIEPRFMPIDIGRMRAGFYKAANKVGAPYHTIGNSTAIRKGMSEGSVKLTKKEFVAINAVPYALDMEKGHKGRKERIRYKPYRFVYATGPMPGFTRRGVGKAAKKVDSLAQPLIIKYFVR